jgi:hypothetical protein
MPSEEFDPRVHTNAVVRLRAGRLGLATISAAMIAGCGGARGLPSCDTFTSPTRTGTCEESSPDAHLVYANLHQTLTLDTVSIKVRQVRVRRTLSSRVGTIRARGRFVVVSLTIANRTGRTQTFDQAALDPGLAENGQVLFAAPGAVYQEEVRTERRYDGSSCPHRSLLAPRASVTCDLVFGTDINSGKGDIPLNVARRTAKAALLVANFGHDAFLGTKEQRGLIRLRYAP